MAKVRVSAIDRAIKKEREKLAKINKAIREKKSLETKKRKLAALKKKVSACASKGKKLRVIFKKKAA